MFALGSDSAWLGPRRPAVTKPRQPLTRTKVTGSEQQSINVALTASPVRAQGHANPAKAISTPWKQPQMWMCRPWVSAWQLTVLLVLLQHIHWSWEKTRGKEEQTEVESPALSVQLSRPQLRCKLRFHMDAAACFHCSLGAIYLSHPIYAMHSGLEHKYPSSYNYENIFCLASLTLAHIHQIQRK